MVKVTIDASCLCNKGGGATYDDTEVLNRIKALEGKTDNFVSEVTVSRDGNKVKLTYTRVDGTSGEVEFEDKDTVALAYDDSTLRAKIEALENKPDKDTVYDDTALKQRVKDLEDKPDKDNQTLSINDRTISISGGNSIELPADKDTIYDDTALKARVKALEDKPEPPHEANLFFAKGDIIGIGSEQDIRITRDELVNADTIKVGDTVVDHYWDNKVFNTGMFKVVSIDGDNIVLNGVNNINYRHPKQELTLSGNKLSISDGNSVTLPSGTAYDDSELKEEINSLGSSLADILHEVSTVKTDSDTRIKALENKVDKDTIYDDTALKGRVTALEGKADNDTITKVTSTSEGVTTTPTTEGNVTTYDVNIDNALNKFYKKEDTYTKKEVEDLIKTQEQKSTDITVYRGTFIKKDTVKEGELETDKTPRATLTYSSSTGVGILKVDFIILSKAVKGLIIAKLPIDAPVPVELIESQVWVGNASTSIYMDKNTRNIRMSLTDNPDIFNKRIIISVPGIFKKA